MAASNYDPNGFAVSLQSQIDALSASIPQPSTALPVGVADASQMGTNAAKYSQEGHTHASKARKQRVLGVNTATYLWTYPSGFASGIVPIVNAIVEDPANSATDTYNVQVVGTPSETSCRFRITRISAGLLGVLLGALSINPTPANINLHCTALEP